MRKSSIAVLSISLLAIASVSAYGVFTIDSAITPAKSTQQVQVTNYSAEIDTLKPQISSLSNNITSLGTVKTDISDIKGKLSDLETKINQVQQDTPTPQKPVMVLDKYSYYQGDTIHITAAGLDPQTAVNMQMVDNSGFVATHRDTLSTSDGKVTFDFPLSLTLASGTYEFRMAAGQFTISQPITIMTSNTAPASLYQFTAQTSRGVYQSGDIFEIFGMGMPNTTVSSVLTSPSGKTLMFNATIQPDGTYDLFYKDSPPFETGNWYITLHNQGLERIVYFTVMSNPPVNPYVFTAQALSSIYQVGNLIGVSGTAQPFTTVDAVLTSPSGIAYDTTVTASSGGSYIVSFATAHGYETGNWYITLTNQGQSRQVSIFLESASSSDSNAFTAQTDKTIYEKGDQIKISGFGKPYTAVRAIMTSPSGQTFDTAVSTSLTGSYDISYPTSSAYETGNWYITLTNQFLSRVVSIYLESTG